MIKLDKQHKNKLTGATSLEEVFPFVQNAIELEHATIPPYLTAMFSLKPGKEREIWDVIHSIVIEEMLHMTISSNIMNAIGGKPAINKSKFVPEYPGGLPMGIGDGLVVGLAAYSKKQVHDVFMQIEEPEYPLDLDCKKKDQALKAAAPEALPDPHYDTIGEFYDALDAAIQKLAPEDLPGNPKLQVTSKFFEDEVLFPITKKSDVRKAINVIVEQGEGSTKTPVDFEGELAHFYKFEELYRGIRIAKDPEACYDYSYSGPKIPFNPKNVWPIYPNTKAAMLAPGSEERRRVDQFNATYHSLLDGLHEVYNGSPHMLDPTIGLMFDLKLYGEKLCGTAFPGKEGYNIGPTFEFIAPH